MNSFIKTNKTLVTYLLIFLIFLPIFGLNFFMSIVGNVLLLFFLITILIVLIIFLSFNFLKSKVSTCEKCGAISLGLNATCINCGADLEDLNIKESKLDNNPGERTIEVKAEEIK
tara:strand:+ start:246 stop:590 length:345 start_codon:yes stop_codon:yes gene_type:complete